jgi:trigger factor
MKPRALEQIKSGLVVEAIAKAEGFVASEEEIEAEYDNLASMYQMEKEEIKKMTGDAYLESIKINIVNRKAAELVASESVEVEVVEEEAQAE